MHPKSWVGRSPGHRGSWEREASTWMMTGEHFPGVRCELCIQAFMDEGTERHQCILSHPPTASGTTGLHMASGSQAPVKPGELDKARNPSRADLQERVSLWPLVGEDPQWALGQKADTLPGLESFHTPQRNASDILRPLYLPVHRVIVGSAGWGLCQLKQTPGRRVHSGDQHGLLEGRERRSH